MIIIMFLQEHDVVSTHMTIDLVFIKLLSDFMHVYDDKFSLTHTLWAT